MKSVDLFLSLLLTFFTHFHNAESKLNHHGSQQRHARSSRPEQSAIRYTPFTRIGLVSGLVPASVDTVHSLVLVVIRDGRECCD